jgi:DNA polymerase
VAAGKKEKRTVAKPGVLGCGYMLSAGEEKENQKTGEMEATGLLGYARNMGVMLTPEQAEESVRVWRATFEDAVAFWWEIDKAAKTCVRTRKPTTAGPVRFDFSAPFMRMWLPSGRYLHYCRPRLEQTILYWCEEKMKFLPKHMCKQINKDRWREKESLTYEGLNDKNQWVRIYTHPGKLTENADQAISRDLLAEAMMRFRERCPRREGRIRLHVHDEIVGMGPEHYGERNLKLLEECMSEPMPWASEWELPLMAKGSVARVWIKD